jgi:membrane protease subunit HflC
MTMLAMFRDNKLTVAALAGLALLLVSSVVVVPETQQVVVVKLGEPVRVLNKFHPRQDFGSTGAGVSMRIPLVEQLVWVDKRLLTFQMERQLVISSDRSRLEVDAFTRYRIIDPVKMVKSAGNTEQVVRQLQSIMSSVLRAELGKNSFQSLLTAERSEVMARIREGLDKQARTYGAQVIDVRIKSADLPASALDSAFQSMQAQREKEAITILAEGQRKAQVIQAGAEAQAAEISANSFGRDPAFYDFYRAMKSYEKTFTGKANKGTSTIILSPDNDYLAQFKGK